LHFSHSFHHLIFYLSKNFDKLTLRKKAKSNRRKIRRLWMKKRKTQKIKGIAAKNHDAFFC